MRQFIFYIKSLFCKHNFETEDIPVTILGDCGEIARQGEKRFMYCKKCTYHYNFWKTF